MSDYRIALSFSLVLLACGGAPPKMAPHPADAEAGPAKIAMIQFRGVDETSERQLRPLILSKIGTSLDRVQVAADVAALWKSGKLDDIRALLSTNKDGSVVLRYQVRAMPRVRTWAIHGTHGNAIPDAEELNRRDEAPLDRMAIAAMRDKIRNALLAKGHFRAQASVAIRDVSDDKVDVTFTVDAGPSAHLKNVVFTGNAAISTAKLLQTIDWSDPVYREKDAAVSLLRITAIYYDKGFVDCRIHPPLVEFSDDETSVNLVVRIEENEAYRLGTISVSGDEILAARDLDRLKSKKGAVFNRSLLLTDMERLRRSAVEDGRGQDVQVIPITHVDKDKRIIDLTYQISAGENSSKP